MRMRMFDYRRCADSATGYLPQHSGQTGTAVNIQATPDPSDIYNMAFCALLHETNPGYSPSSLNLDWNNHMAAQLTADESSMLLSIFGEEPCAQLGIK